MRHIILDNYLNFNNYRQAYRGLISATNSDIIESLPVESDSPAGMSEVAALFVTPVGHSLVIINQGNQ